MKLTLIYCVCLTLMPTSDPEIQHVKKQVMKLRDAMVAADGIQLRALTAESLSYGHSNGVVEQKPEFIESIISGKYNFISIDIDDLSIDITGDLAIVRHRFFAHTHDKDKEPTTVNLHVLTIWNKEDNEWRLFARQATRFPN